jgi:glucuronoarabinoxylan endo-1,4-beta-xylanase
VLIISSLPAGSVFAEPLPWNVTYNLNGADGTPPVDPLTYSSASNKAVILDITDGAAAAPAGKEFVGWTPVKALADRGVANAHYAPGKTITLSADAQSLHGVELFAVWLDVAAGPFDVEFRTKVASLTVASQSVAKGGKVLKPADLSCDGYTFGGWYSDAYFREEFKWDFDDDTVTKDLVLHAKWSEAFEPANVPYTVTYHLSPGLVGSVPESQTVSANNGEGGSANVRDLTADTVAPSGKVFAGWSTTAKRILELKPGDMMWVKSEGLHLYDVWEDANPAYSNAVTVNFGDVKQKMTGLGDSLAFHRSAHYLQLKNKFDDAGITGAQNPAYKLVELAMDTEKGAGMDVFRIIIGDGGIIDPVSKAKWGNQQTDGPSDTIWPEPGEENIIWIQEDWENHPELAAKFDEDQLWYVREALKFNPDMKINACAWTPPYWMKSNLGVRNDVPDNPYPSGYKGTHDVQQTILEDVFYPDYAKYLVEYAWGMYAWLNLPIYALSPTNEPEIDHPYSSQVIHGDDYERFMLKYLKPEFEKAISEGRFAPAGSETGGGTGYDAVAPMPLISAPEGTRIDRSTSPVDLGTPDRPGLGAMMAKEEIQDFVDIFGTHVYEYTQFRYEPQVAEAGYFYPDYMYNYPDIWMNEISRQWATYGGGVNDINMRNALHWARLINNLFASEPGFSSYQYWFGTYGGFFAFQSVGTNSFTGQVRIYKRFFTFAQYSRFMDSNYYRVGVDERKPFKGANVTAYKNGEDFSIVILNEDEAAHTITLSLNGNDANGLVPYRTSDSENVRKLPVIAKTDGSFTVTLPPLSMTTLVNDKGADNLPGLDIRDGSFPLSPADNDGQSAAGITASAGTVAGAGTATEGEITVYDGSWIKYSNFNFADGTLIAPATVNRTMRMAASAAPIYGGQIELRIDAPDGKLVGVVDIPAGSGAPQYYGQIDTGDTAAYGFHDLYLVFKGKTTRSGLFKLSNIAFDSVYTPLTGNLITNGVFANAANWEGNGAAIARAASPAYRSGTGSLLVSARTVGSGAAQTLNGLESGEKYKLNAFFLPPVPTGNITTNDPHASTYAECGDAEVSLLYYKDGASVGSQLIASREKISTLDWAQVGAEFTYTPPAADFDTVKIQFATSTDDNFYLADVSLVKLESPGAPASYVKVHNSARVSAKLKAGEFQLTPSTDGTDYEFISANPGIATVDGSGLVTLHRSGSVTITLRTTDGSNLTSSLLLIIAP